MHKYALSCTRVLLSTNTNFLFVTCVLVFTNMCICKYIILQTEFFVSQMAFCFTNGKWYIIWWYVIFKTNLSPLTPHQTAALSLLWLMTLSLAFYAFVLVCIVIMNVILFWSLSLWVDCICLFVLVSFMALFCCRFVSLFFISLFDWSDN